MNPTNNAEHSASRPREASPDEPNADSTPERITLHVEDYSDLLQNQQQATPWWKSQTIIASLVAIVAGALHSAHLSPIPDDVLGDAVTLLISFIAGCFAIRGRIKAKGPIAKSAALLFFASFAPFVVTSCSSFAVTGKICRTDHGTTYCLDSDGKVATVSASDGKNTVGLSASPPRRVSPPPQ